MESRRFVVCGVFWIALTVLSLVAASTPGDGYDAPNAAPPSTAYFDPYAIPPPTVAPRTEDDGRFTVRLSDGSSLVGSLEGMDNLVMQALVGEVTIPVDKVTQILTPPDAKQTVVTFRNGDRLTGEIRLDAVRLKTAWGEVSVNPQHVVAIVRGNSSRMACHQIVLPDGTIQHRYDYRPATPPYTDPCPGPPCPAPPYRVYPAPPTSPYIPAVPTPPASSYHPAAEPYDVAPSHDPVPPATEWRDGRTSSESGAP
ncbi:MAG: hypothetical protein ACYTG0_41530 [Planctomycetota bacterium]